MAWDTTSPVISLYGDAQLSLDAGSLYSDAGATGSDNLDPDIISCLEYKRGNILMRWAETYFREKEPYSIRGAASVMIMSPRRITVARLPREKVFMF